MSALTTLEFNKCCGNPAVCTEPSLYPCKLRKEYLEERGQSDSVAAYMEPGGKISAPFSMEQDNNPGQTVFSGDALRAQETASREAAVEAMKARFRADALKATERANSPEARAEREALALRRNKGRGFGMDM